MIKLLPPELLIHATLVFGNSVENIIVDPESFCQNTENAFPENIFVLQVLPLSPDNN